MARDVGGAPRLSFKALFEGGPLAGLTDGPLLERYATGRGQTAEPAFATLIERHGPTGLRARRGGLEGRTCEETARHPGCPVGTVFSRLAPAVGAVAAALSTGLRAGGMPAALAQSTARPGLCAGAGTRGGRRVLGRLRQLAEDDLGSLLMAKLTSVGAALVAALGACLMTNWTLPPGFGAQVPPAGGGANATVERGQDPNEVPLAGGGAAATVERGQGPDLAFPIMNDKDRLKDFAYAEIGKMRPLVKDEKGVRFQNRQAVLYKDGTAKLWSFEQKDPVGPTMRHKQRIRELTFFDESTLLVTASDDSVKVWDALTGEARKELDGQAIRPMWLSFAPGAKRFVTIDAARMAVTVWDAVGLTAVGTLRAGRAVEAAGLSGDGRTVVTFRFGADPSAELWDVTSGRVFATLRPPSPSIAEVFTEGGADLNRSKLQHDARFWEVVRSLAPAAGERAD